VKVTDFGIARAVNAETITETAAVFGTAAYVSPEQAQGETVDRRTDVYSLGCVLYELLAGRQPFHADSAVALAYQHVSAIPPPPSQLSDESTPELDAVTAKAMAKDPTDRYQTAREFNADLERARAGMPVVAPLVGAWAATQAANRWNEQTVTSSPAGGGTATYPAEEEPYDEPPYDDEEPRGRAGWIIALVLLLLALVAGGWWLFTTLAADEVDTAEMPDVVGTQEDEARQELEALGFTDITTEEVERSGPAENEVVAQDPEPSNQPIAVDTPIILTVNVQPPLATVPDVAGDTPPEAVQEIRDANLRVGQRRREFNEDVPQGQVIRTEPAAGQEVPQNTAINLIISRGSNQATVPDVIDLPEDTAIQELAEACDPTPCFEAVTTEQFDDTVAEGRVFQQVPDAGRELQKGQQVTLFISRGPEPPPEPEPTTTTVPDVVDETLNEATRMLQEAGLAIGEVTQASSPDIDAGSVIETDPEAGEEVEELTRVDLVISTGPEPPADGDDTSGNGSGDGTDGGGQNTGEEDG
jgi:serine/threonine-protein kinase